MEEKIIKLMKSKHKRKMSVEDCAAFFNISEMALLSKLKNPSFVRRTYKVDPKTGAIQSFLEKTS
ncbi:TPA: hypothetical protein ACWWDF_002434 [Enterococcus faecium]